MQRSSLLHRKHFPNRPTNPRTQKQRGTSNMKINTETQRNALRRIMQMLSIKDMNRKTVVKKLTSQVTVQIDNERTSRPRIYKRTSDASEFVKNIVKSDKIPVQKTGEKLTLTHLQKIKSGGIRV